MAFGKVAFGDSLRIALTAGKPFKLPAQVKGILHTGIHPLATGRAMDVRCIPKQKYSAHTVSRGDAFVYREIRQPLRIKQAQVRQARAINMPLNFIECRLAAVIGVLPKREKAPDARLHGKDEDGAVRTVRKDDGIFGGSIDQLSVGQDKNDFFGDAGKIYR